MSALTLYLLGAAYTAAALVVYAYRWAVATGRYERQGLALSWTGAALIVVVAVGWFLLVPVGLALHAMDFVGVVSLPMERFRQPAPPAPERHAAVKLAPAPAAEGPAGDAARPTCPSCKEPVPVDARGFFTRHHRVDGERQAYCAGSRTKAPTRP